MKGMKGSEAPKEHWEKDMSKVDCADLKYSGEFSAPEDYKKSVDGLSNYVKKNKMSY